MPAALSLIADYHRERTRSLAIGINMTGIYFRQAMGGFGATLAVMYGWHGTFHSFGLIGIAYSVVLMFLLCDTPRHIGAVKTEEKKRLPVFKGYGNAACQRILLGDSLLFLRAVGTRMGH